MNQELDTPPLYQAILDGFAANAGSDVSSDAIGMVAWERLSGAQRRDALSTLLSVYVLRVREEESARKLERAVWDPTHTYLAEFDTAMVQDAACTPANAFGEVPVDLDSLRNVLHELDLLQHRLAMRDAADQEGQS